MSDPAQAGTERSRSVVITLKTTSGQRRRNSVLVSDTAISAKEIQTARERRDLIEYYSSGREWFVFVLKKDGIAARKLGALDLDREVLEFRAALIDPSSRNYTRGSQALYMKLVAPVSRLIGTGRVTVVPHGPLHYLPFSALSSPKIPWWTMRRYACCRLPPSIIPHGPGRREKPAMHIMGNPDMVGSPVRPEVRAEEAKSDCPGSCAIDTAAARPGEGFVFRRHASSFNLVHLAGHVFSTRTTPCDRRCSWRVTFPATAAQGRRLTASI